MGVAEKDLLMCRVANRGYRLGRDDNAGNDSVSLKYRKAFNSDAKGESLSMMLPLSGSLQSLSHNN